MTYRASDSECPPYCSHPVSDFKVYRSVDRRVVNPDQMAAEAGGPKFPHRTRPGVLNFKHACSESSGAILSQDLARVRGCRGSCGTQLQK